MTNVTSQTLYEKNIEIKEKKKNINESEECEIEECDVSRLALLQINMQRYNFIRLFTLRRFKHANVKIIMRFTAAYFVIPIIIYFVHMIHVKR